MQDPTNADVTAEYLVVDNISAMLPGTDTDTEGVPGSPDLHMRSQEVESLLKLQ